MAFLFFYTTTGFQTTCVTFDPCERQISTFKCFLRRAKMNQHSTLAFIILSNAGKALARLRRSK